MADKYPRLFGRYKLLAPLAQGGMGALYLACVGDKGLERMCVIKTVLPHLADPEYVSRFRDEAKVVVRLSHGNLVPVFDAGLVGNELYLAEMAKRAAAAKKVEALKAKLAEQTAAKSDQP